MLPAVRSPQEGSRANNPENLVIEETRMFRTLLTFLTLACLTIIADAAPPKPDVKKDCAEIGEVAHAFAAMRDTGMTLARARNHQASTQRVPCPQGGCR